jgi:hypothetical protein
VARLIDSLLKMSGASGIGGALFSLAISIFGLRRRQRWAWLTMWTWPLLFVLIWLMTPAPNTFTIVSYAIVVILTVALLALSYRKYDTRGQLVNRSEG